MKRMLLFWFNVDDESDYCADRKMFTKLQKNQSTFKRTSPPRKGGNKFEIIGTKISVKIYEK